MMTWADRQKDREYEHLVNRLRALASEWRRDGYEGEQHADELEDLLREKALDTEAIRGV